jgi:hypothetical protein
MSLRQRLPAVAVAVAPPAAAAFGVTSTLLWQLKGALVIPAVCALVLLFASPALAVAAVSLLAAFDDYIRPAVIYRDFLVVDVIGFALIAGVAKRRPAFPAGAAGLTLGLAALTLFCGFNIVSLGPLNWTEAVDNVARLLYFTALVAAIGIVSPHVPLRPIVWALVGSLLARFLYEGFYYFGGSAFVLHFSYQFGAITSNANTLGGLGACVLPLSCSLALRGRRALRRVAAAITLALSAGIFLS